MTECHNCKSLWMPKVCSFSSFWTGTRRNLTFSRSPWIGNLLIGSKLDIFKVVFRWHHYRKYRNFFAFWIETRRRKLHKWNFWTTPQRALLQSGSPFGSPGPHGDLFKFLGPQKVLIFFQGPHFLYFSLKNVLKVRVSTIYYMWTIWKGEFSETRLVTETGTNLSTKLSHILLRCFSIIFLLCISRN